MIVLDDVCMQYATHTVLEGVNVRIPPEARMALVGANGTGKSTLLKIIAGELEPASGTVHRPGEMRIGYLPQSGLAHHGRTLWEEMLTAIPEWLAARNMRRDLLEKISRLAPDDPEHPRTLSRYGELEVAYQQEDGYARESRLRSILDGLGFQNQDLERPVEEFSAGWQMRLGLAKLLARSPDFMLLDEPTDHLDLDAKNWLEDYLEGVGAGFLLVSHDRHLLDKLAKSLAEIHDTKLEVYNGNYSTYLQERRKREEQNMDRVLQQQREIRKMEDFIARNRVRKSSSRQVQSRIKQMEKMERVAPEARRPGGIRFQFQTPSRPPRVLVEVEGLDKSFPGRTIFQQVNLAVERGERIAVLGPNGSGKSTLLRILAGRERYDTGIRVQDDKVSIGWFSQDAGEGFKKEKIVLDAILNVDPQITQESARGLLAKFRFRGEDVFKPIEALSGGERVRLALARLLLHRHHLLLLDEPTNHLDIQGRQALLEALGAYSGAIVFVSHDRYFIQELADRVLEIRDGVVTSFPGTYEDYLLAGDGGGLSPHIVSRVPVGATNRHGAAFHADEKQERVQQHQERKAVQRAEQKRQRRIQETEEQISTLEAELAVLDREMLQPGVAEDYARLGKLHERAAGIRRTLDEHYALWDALSTQGGS